MLFHEDRIKSEKIINGYFDEGNRTQVLGELATVNTINCKVFFEHELYSTITLDELLEIITLTQNWNKNLGRIDFLTGLQSRAVDLVNDIAVLKYRVLLEQILVYGITVRSGLQTKVIQKLKQLDPVHYTNQEIVNIRLKALKLAIESNPRGHSVQFLETTLFFGIIVESEYQKSVIEILRALSAERYDDEKMSSLDAEWELYNN